MRGVHQARASESRLRVVFEDGEVSFGFPIGTTLGAVTDWVAGLTKRHESGLLAVDVKMPRRAASSIASTEVSHATH